MEIHASNQLYRVHKQDLPWFQILNIIIKGSAWDMTRENVVLDSYLSNGGILHDIL